MENIKNVYILGKDKIGWSIDNDNFYVTNVVNSFKVYNVTNSLFKADIIYVVWWNVLLSKKFRIFNFFFRKKLIATITNDLSHQEKDLKKIMKYVDLFVVANTKQKKDLISFGICEKKIKFNPFYVDEKIFKKLLFSKNELCKKLNISYELLKNKILIGNFQRDSLGCDLSMPKWQKNPDLLIDIITNLDREKYILILAGPRRHYVINKCKECKINYFYIGDEGYIDKNKDDIYTNNLSIEKMSLLYNLIDLYIVTSISEGGPKAIPESILCSTPVISTDVGFACDLLYNDDIFFEKNEAIEKIEHLLTNHKVIKSKVHKFYTEKAFSERIKNILNEVT